MARSRSKYEKRFDARHRHGAKKPPGKPGPAPIVPAKPPAAPPTAPVTPPHEPAAPHVVEHPEPIVPPVAPAKPAPPPGGRARG